MEYDLEAGSFSIPPLTIQPLVENAVTHGALARDDGLGWVRLSTEDRGRFVRVVVEDSGAGADGGRAGKRGNPFAEAAATGPEENARAPARGKRLLEEDPALLRPRFALCRPHVAERRERLPHDKVLRRFARQFARVAYDADDIRTGLICGRDELLLVRGRAGARPSRC